MPDPLKLVMGSCDGTGADLYVCLGFMPKYVKVYNLEDSHSLFKSMEYWEDMEKITAFARGLTEYTGTTYRQIAGLTSDGILHYHGGTKLVYLSAAHPHWVEKGSTTDVTEKYIDGTYKAQASLSPAYRSYGDFALGHTPTAADYGAEVTTAEGFIIEDDSVLNVDGEQLIWMAIG